jgi:hypothetical protein
MAVLSLPVLWILACQVALSAAKGTLADSSTAVAGQDAETMLQQVSVLLEGLPWWAYAAAVTGVLGVLYFTFGG